LNQTRIKISTCDSPKEVLACDILVCFIHGHAMAVTKAHTRHMPHYSNKLKKVNNHAKHNHMMIINTKTNEKYENEHNFYQNMHRGAEN